MKKALILILLLSSCVNKPKPDLRLYQPDTLILEANVEIITAEGKYRPPFQETWFSKKTVERLETIISNL